MSGPDTSTAGRAASAAPALAELGPDRRQRGLRALADAVESARAGLVDIADRETRLGRERLDGEVGRTATQLRLFADVLGGDGWRDVRVDRATPGPPPTPEIVRYRVAMGPALIFAASNFPFAFGVLGTDTASAFAAGCPVVLKTNPGHPQTSRATVELAQEVLASEGWPAGSLTVVDDEQSAVAILQDPRIRVATFTGSPHAGRALFDLASRRPDPLPFFAEMGSVNPVLVTPAAARERSSELALGLAGSFSLGVGQFCTKPGLVFVPEGSELERDLVDAVSGLSAAPMLTPRIAAGHAAARRALSDLGGSTTIAHGRSGAPDEVSAEVIAVDADAFARDAAVYTEECFGPTVVLVRYRDVNQLDALVDQLPASLTATIHVAADEEPPAALVERLVGRVGRLVWNGWPTGLVVGQAMHHGGPYPATTSAQFSSVGATAIDRFLRPVAFQNVPHTMLPPDVVRQLNGAASADEEAS